MRAEVRDDIISLNSFVEAKFKYEKYIKKIKDSGNFCFLDQFKHHFKNGESLAKAIEEVNLIKTANFNNFKYIYLTDTAIKYLDLKDDPKDYSHLSKDQIKVTRISKYPSDKILFSSSLKFTFLATDEKKYDFFIKDILLDKLKKEFYENYLNINALELDVLRQEIDNYNNNYEYEKKIIDTAIDSIKSIGIKSLDEIENEKNELESTLKKIELEIQELNMLQVSKKK